MSCRNFEPIIAELARGQMMDVRVKEDARVHMETCERCARHFADEQTLTAGLRAVAVTNASTQAPARVEAALLSAFRHGANAPIAAAQVPVKTVEMPWLPWSIAAAAVLLIFSAFGLPRLLPDNSRKGALESASKNQPVNPLPPTIVTPDTAQPEERPLQASNDFENPQESAIDDAASPRPIDRRRALMQNAGLRDRPARRANNRAANASASEEITTEFLPITYGGNLPQLDEGQLVRVELPRSALQSFGLPVNAERAGERVKADVLLGHDGVARAIRFVR
jgi:hypothetical protein